MTIKASADQVAQLPDGRIVIAKPGTDVIYKYEDGSGQELWPVAQHPVDLVAVTKPCRTCKGRGFTNYMFCEECGGHCVPVPKKICRGCHAGHPLFDLKVQCVCWAGDESHVNAGPFVSCSICSNSGSVTHAGLYVPGKLLPIVAVGEAVYPQIPHFAYVSKAGALRTVDHANQTDTYVGRPPFAARPGWYAVIAERSET